MKNGKITIDPNRISFRHKYFGLTVVVLIVSFFASGAKATTYYSPYGATRTWSVTVATGTHSFQVDGIAANKNTEWYVNGAYTGSDENDWSGSLAIDPEYTMSFSSGTTKIEGVVYDRYWNFEERHTWNVTVAQPDLIAYNCSVSDTTVDPGQNVTVYWTAKNQGTGSAGSTQQGVMWSSNSTISRSDSLFEREYLGSMSPNQTSSEAHTITIPTNATPGSTYYLGVYADYDLDESESNENNNGSNGVAVTINIPDLIAYNASVSDTTVDPGQSVTVYWTAKNQGTSSAESTQQGVMWSTSSTIDRSDSLLEKEYLGGMGVNQTSSEAHAITIPPSATPGQTYYLGAYADYDLDESESNENNNGSNGVAVTINLPPEIISPPTNIIGDMAVYKNTSHSYTASGASSNLGHSLEYRFDWDDGSGYSNWGSATQSHSWSTAGDYYINAQARCATHTDKESVWSTINWHVTVLNPPQITVASPNGGEPWQAGTEEPITWNSTETVGEYVRIELYKDDAFYNNIVTSTENDGVYTWPIPLGLPAGTTYQVKIIDTANSSTDDYSNGYFYIAAAAIPEPDLISVSGIPSNIEIGQNFTVTITSQNNGLISPEGAIHAAVQHSSGSCFAHVDELQNISWATNNKHYAPDEENTEIFNKDETSPRGYPPADWFLEAWENGWDNNVQHSMSFQVRPLATGTINILVRTTMQSDSGIWVNDISADTSNPIQNDEQGWQCRLYTVNVEPPEYGATIITHGFQLDILNGDYLVPEWAVWLGWAITDRADSGSVFVYQPGTGVWRFATGESTPNPDNEIVLLFDWFLESDRGVEDKNGLGYSEAAGDALFTALKAPKFVDSGGNQIAGFENINILEKKLHFIGHSRGAVVNSMAIRRIAEFSSTTVDHVTTLDPHPVLGSDPDNTIYTWEYVVEWADNYWRADSPLILDPDGEYVNGAYNQELQNAVFLSGGYDSPFDGGSHSDVHLWYNGTIDINADAFDGEEDVPAEWYDYLDMGPRDSTGYSYSRIGGGINSRPTESGTKTNPVDYPIDYIFNGDFELRGPGTDKFPGWHYHGGQTENTTGNIVGNDENYYLYLNDNDWWLTHNRLYVPENATGISFKLRISNRSNDGDYFRIYFDDGDTVSDWAYLTLESTSDWMEWQWSIPLDDRGKVGTITVEIVGQGGDVDSSVDVDNLDFSIDTEIPILSVVPSNKNVSSSSGTTSFSVSNTGGGTMPWTAQVIDGASWLSITSGESGTDNGIIQASFTENTSATSRVGTIRVTATGANGSPTDVTVAQAGTGGVEQFNLTTNVQGQGDIALNPSGGIYDSETTVQMTANPDSGWYFDHWEGALSGSENPETILMNGNKTVTAVFEQNVIVQYTLTTGVVGGNGSISPASRSYTEGTVVPLVAAPDPGYRVKAWVGTDNDPSARNNNNSVTMDSDKDVTVEFEIIPTPDPDVHPDGIVNLIDFSILSARWQDTGCGELGNWCDGADVDYSGAVNFEDLSYLCENWLTGTSGRDAIVVQRGPEIAVEIEGAAGRIFVPVDLSQSISGLSGLAARGDTVYVLNRSSYSPFPPPYGTTEQQLLIFDLKTGLLTQTIDIPPFSGEPGLSDITVLDGNIYASWASGGTVKIRKIESDGTLTDVFSQQNPGDVSPNRPLIAANNETASVILALRSSSSIPSYPNSYCVVDPLTWTVSNQVTEPSFSAPFNIVMSNNSQYLIEDTYPYYVSQYQSVLSIPDFGVVGSLNYPYTYGSTSVPMSSSTNRYTSDEFFFDYDSNLPAVAVLANSNHTGADLTGKKLFRQGQIAWQSDSGISNFAVPDGTLIDTVGLNNFSWLQSAGTPVQITTTLEPVGDLSLRKLMHNEFALDVDTAQRGIYDLTAQVDLRGIYYVGGEQSERSINVNNTLRYAFAVDPVSDNLVGNGDFTLSTYGWNDAGLVVSDSEVVSRPDVLWMTPYSSSPDEVTQLLELPLSQNMELSFDYRLRDFPGDSCNLLITLDGITIAEINDIQPSSVYQHFSVPVTDPSFNGLTDAELRLQVSSTGSSWFYIDDIVLHAN
jgi:hypothetical protein